MCQQRQVEGLRHLTGEAVGPLTQQVRPVSTQKLLCIDRIPGACWTTWVRQCPFLVSLSSYRNEVSRRIWGKGLLVTLLSFFS